MSRKFCLICHQPFETSRNNKKYCSNECCMKASNRKHQERKLAARRKTSTNDRRGSESIPVAEMHLLNTNAPRHDREVIEKKGIESPDLSQMKYKVYDPKLRITRYFPTKERYEKFLNKQTQEV